MYNKDKLFNMDKINVQILEKIILDSNNIFDSKIMTEDEITEKLKFFISHDSTFTLDEFKEFLSLFGKYLIDGEYLIHRSDTYLEIEKHNYFKCSGMLLMGYTPLKFKFEIVNTNMIKIDTYLYSYEIYSGQDEVLDEDYQWFRAYWFNIYDHIIKLRMNDQKIENHTCT